MVGSANWIRTKVALDFFVLEESAMKPSRFEAWPRKFAILRLSATSKRSYTRAFGDLRLQKIKPVRTIVRIIDY